MKTKIPKLFFDNNETIEFSPEDIDWNDETVCILCMRKVCICTIQKCPCEISSDQCNWPSDFCPCQKCDNFLINCQCKIYIKKED